MTEPSRLREASHYPAARALLEAGLSDNPRRGAARRVAAGLGLSAGALATVTSSTAAGAASSLAAAGVGASGAGLAGAASSVLAVVGQWLAIGVFSGLCLAGGTAYVMSKAPLSSHVARSLDLPAQPSARSSAHAAGIPLKLTPVSEAAEPGTSGLAVASSNAAHGAAELPVLAHSSAARVAALTERASPSSLDLSSASGRLGREVSLIDEARRALAAGSSAHALTTLDQYSALDRTGTLDREAQILRIQALTASGQVQAAAPLARSYLRAYPADPHAAMLEQLLSGVAAELAK